MDDSLGFRYERNQYFTGKLLTAQDFKVEQKYFNDKRRLLNRFLFGSGIVCGLEVTPTGDKRISIEPGIVLDGVGREIVIDSLSTCDLSGIGGFPEGEFNGFIYLFIEYEEKNKDQVYSIDSTQQAAFYNRVLESYKLSIRKTPPERWDTGLAVLIEEISLIYEDSQVRLWHRVPRYVNPLGGIEASFILEKLVPAPRLAFSCEITAVNLELYDRDNTRITFNEPMDSEETQYEWKYLLRAGRAFDDGRILLGGRNLSLRIGDRAVSFEKDTEVKVQVIATSVPEKILQNYFALSLDKLMEDASGKGICLAKISLNQMITPIGTTFHINKVERAPFSQYVYNIPLLRLLDQYDKSFSGTGPAPEKPASPPKGPVPEIVPAPAPVPRKVELPPPPGLKMATDTVDFEWEPKIQGYYTDEISHGLGPGPVMIITGIEEIQDILTPDPAKSDDRIFIGSGEVFQGTPHAPSARDMSIGVIVYPNKGTFRIGITLRGRARVENTRIRWWAYRDETGTMADKTEI